MVENGAGKRGGAATGVPDDCIGDVVRRRRSTSEGFAGAGEGCTGGLAFVAFARICARFRLLGAGGKEGGAACTGDGITGGADENDGA
jgi:hypothetical protein